MPEELRRTGWLRLAIPASHEGRKCLFLPPAGRPDDPNDKIQYSVYSFPELKKQEAVSLNQVIPAGGFWWVTLRLKNLPDDKREVEQVEVFNDEGRKVVSIEHEEGRKMAYTAGRFPGYARVAEDGRILLLAFQGSGYCTFGVFDTSSGKFLWGARTAGVTIRGNPVVRRTEVWALETQGSSLALVRYRPGGEGAGNEGRRDVIMKYPVNANVTADQFNPSPDGSHFVQAIDGKPSRLLFIPAREGVTDKDVVCVELRD
ncbi:MAG: hypothetical protein FJ288_08145 [Planctomycetes bacterium]|nr:hypothetical protein [Planctomycetota bacterium]